MAAPANQQQLPGKLGEIQKTIELETAEIKKIEAGKFTQTLPCY